MKKIGLVLLLCGIIGAAIAATEAKKADDKKVESKRNYTEAEFKKAVDDEVAKQMKKAGASHLVDFSKELLEKEEAIKKAAAEKLEREKEIKEKEELAKKEAEEKAIEQAEAKKALEKAGLGGAGKAVSNVGKSVGGAVSSIGKSVGGAIDINLVTKFFIGYP